MSVLLNRIAVVAGIIHKKEDPDKMESREINLWKAAQIMAFFKEWGDESCPHGSRRTIKGFLRYLFLGERTINPKIKRQCNKCWQGL